MDEPSIGIDLGTTNSVVATVIGGKPRIIERREGQRLLASMVGYTPRGERLVGEEARALARTHPQNVAFATKRLMGQRWTPELAAHYRSVFPFPLVAGPNEDVRVKLADRAIPVAQIAAALLGELHRDAVAYLRRDVTKTVITVPANFNDAQRQATKEAAQIAGLEVVRLINEPTAAALAYGVQTKFQGRVLVFDLGGGTLDVSILEMRDGVFEVVGTGGDAFLGGEDFDNAVVAWLGTQLPAAQRERLLHDRSVVQQLKTVAEQLKCTLSVAQEAPISTTLTAAQGSVPLEVRLTRQRFEELVGGLVERCIKVVDKTVEEARLPFDSITQVILVGGMTRVPAIRERVGQRFGLDPSTHLFPDEVVALGAAIHANDLVSRSSSSVLLDIVSSTLGVGVAGGLSRPLLAKNRSLPCRAKDVFYPAGDAQTVVRIPVVQGESHRLRENHLLGEVVLDGLVGHHRNEKAIEVSFELDLDGSLSVQACEVATGRTASVKVKARTDLQPQEIERLRQEEARRQQLPEDDPERRVHNAELRRDFRRRLVAFRKLHVELVQAATESCDQAAQMVVDVLGTRLVEAERLEQAGTVAEVEAMTRNLEELIASLQGAPAEPAKAPPEPAKVPEPAMAAPAPQPAEPPPPPPPAATAPEAAQPPPLPAKEPEPEPAEPEEEVEAELVEGAEPAPAEPAPAEPAPAEPAKAEAPGAAAKPAESRRAKKRKKGKGRRKKR